MVLLRGDYEIEIFFIISSFALLCYGSFIAIFKAKYTFSYFANDVKTAVFLVFTLLFLIPVLKSLTVAYSEDTIIILVVSKIIHLT